MEALCWFFLQNFNIRYHKVCIFSLLLLQNHKTMDLNPCGVFGEFKLEKVTTGTFCAAPHHWGISDRNSKEWEVILKYSFFLLSFVENPSVSMPKVNGRRTVSDHNGIQKPMNKVRLTSKKGSLISTQKYENFVEYFFFHFILLSYWYSIWIYKRLRNCLLG